MNTLKLLLLTTLLISCSNSEKENKIKLASINELIPAGYEIVESGNELNKIRTDLNNDGIPDYVILLASGKNNKDYSNSKDIRLAIFEGKKNGSYKFKSQSGNLTASFLHINLDKRIRIANKNIIHLKHQSMRHDYELKFKYESKYENYMLIGYKYNNYGNATHEGSRNVDINFLSKKNISTTSEKNRKKIEDKLKPISAINDSNIYELIR